MKNFIFYLAISFSVMSFTSYEELSNMATSPNNISGSSSSNASPLSRKERLAAEKRDAFNKKISEMQITAAVIAKQTERTKHQALGNNERQTRDF